MSIRQDFKGSGWLTALLGGKRAHITGLLSEIAALTSLGLNKPSIFRKFLDLLSQLGAERAKEHEILTRIEDVERLHYERREQHKLETANPDYLADTLSNDYVADQKTGKRTKRLSWVSRLFAQPQDADNNQ